MSTDDAGYFRLLEEEMGLYGQLAAVRAEKNDLHDAKMRAWEQNRDRVGSGAQFEELWRQAKPPGKDEYLQKKEREILDQLHKIQRLSEHLKFAGLAGSSDGADSGRHA